jgi:hypothetical protein
LRRRARFSYDRQGGEGGVKTIDFDDSRWPLITIRYAAQVDERDFDQLLALLDQNIQRTVRMRQKTAVIYDSRSGWSAPPAIRKKQADWMKKHADITRTNCVAIAFVMNSAVVRGVLTAVLWLSDMPTAYRVVGTVSEAEEWCAEQYAAHGLSMPTRSATARIG